MTTPTIRAGRLIQVGDIMRASWVSPFGPRTEKDVTVAWVSENGHRIRTTDGESYQAPDLVATGSTAADVERLDRIRALSHDQKRSLLCFLDGYSPDGVDAWFDGRSAGGTL